MPDTVPPNRPESQPSGQSISSSNRSEVLGLMLDQLHAEIWDYEQKYVDAMAEALAYRELFFEALTQLAEERTRLLRTNERLRQLSGAIPWHPEEGQ